MKTHKKSSDKINIITLGCSKNIVDSEFLLAQLSAQSLNVEHDAENSDAKTIIINTCGFIIDAKKESIDTILRYAHLKASGHIENLYVIGCLAERYKKELLKEIPEVDAFFGVNDIRTIIQGLGYNYYKELIGDRILSTPKHFAYLKIAEGCNRKCSFCAIPFIRGIYISKPIETLVTEVKNLVKAGVKEIILIAQDLSWYGRDIYKKPVLAELINQLSDINGIEWIRLHYTYPADFPMNVLTEMKSRSNVCHYLDLPFQHISDKVLKKMRRGNTSAQTYELIDVIRDQVPDIALRTTLLTGHPGESEKDFIQLLDFVEKVKFDRLGIFAYSHEEDTYSYKNFKDTLPSKVKQKRVEDIMNLQQAISKELNHKKTGQTFKVLIDRIESNTGIGRTQYDSPEIDNEVIIENTDNSLKTGEFVNVKITAASEYDLIGNVI